MIPLETIWLPRPSSKYPGCYPIGFENKIKIILGTNYVHFFSGMAKTGFRIDVNPDVKPDLVANVEQLGIKDNSFEAGLADPPYTEEFAKTLYNTPYPKWSLWTKELVRIVKPGGRIAIMQNYVVPRLPDCDYTKILVIVTRIKQYPKIVTIQTKR
ncbi:MAG: class I SAM-dependent methyltransferase [Spirochaetes bacterium]|nr:class I SAM-dependent methyltransferase [Spirochaetota bacterium]